MSEIRPSSSSSATSGLRRVHLAETNQFSAPAQGTEGVVTINLRGLGAGRTLTLINGRRQVATESNGVDVSAFPMSAFARTEILKDARCGNVRIGRNRRCGELHHSRTDFEGIEISGSNTWIDESNGNNTIDVIGGLAGERWSALSRRRVRPSQRTENSRRDWGLRPFAENFNGGWSANGDAGHDVSA